MEYALAEKWKGFYKKKEVNEVSFKGKMYPAMGTKCYRCDVMMFADEVFSLSKWISG